MVFDWLYNASNAVILLLLLPLAYLYARFLKAIVDALVEPQRGTRWTWWPVIIVFAVTLVALGPLNFKEISYGSTGIASLLMAVIWTRNLLRGEHWLFESTGRLDSEYIGPITAALIGLGFTWSAFDPFF
jgi:hypothetical protein